MKEKYKKLQMRTLSNEFLNICFNCPPSINQVTTYHSLQFEESKYQLLYSQGSFSLSPPIFLFLESLNYL